MAAPPLLRSGGEGRGEEAVVFLQPLPADSLPTRSSRHGRDRRLSRLRHQLHRPWRKSLPTLRAPSHPPASAGMRRRFRAGRTRFAGSLTAWGTTANSTVVHTLTRMMAGSMFLFMRTLLGLIPQGKGYRRLFTPYVGRMSKRVVPGNLDSYFGRLPGNLIKMFDNMDIRGNNRGVGGSNPR